MTTKQNSTQEISRLRELLFREERQVISDIERVVIKHDRLVDKHEERIGDDPALQRSVSKIIAPALRDADVTDHKKLAASISPLVVTGIKREIRNSRDEMVDALYPILGRLVSAYVASVFKTFVEETNKRLESGLTGRFFWLRLRALWTGTPYHELVLREGKGLEVRELFLIRKGSGILLDYWEAIPEDDDEDVFVSQRDEYLVSSLLTAINEFAGEAFARGHNELRALDVGESRIYLRASPAYLLAAKCAGFGSPKLERLLDRGFLAILDKHGELLVNGDNGEDRRQLRAVLPELAEELNTALTPKKGPPVLAIAFFSLIGLAIAGYAGWQMLDSMRKARIHDQVTQVIAARPEFLGLPMEISVADDRSMVTVTGLAPSRPEGDALLSAIEAAIAPVTVTPELAYMPEPQQIEVTRADLRSLAGELEAMERRLASAGDVRALSGRLDGLMTRISGLGDRETVFSGQDEVNALAARLAALDARLDAVAASEDVRQLAAELKTLTTRLYTPWRRLDDWVRSHAIFFGDEVGFRSPDLANAQLKELSGLLMASDAGLRIIGYTDPTGSLRYNRALAARRASRVAQELAALGVPEHRLKILRRPSADLLSYDKGPLSSNRRVEFEITYVDEPVEATGDPLDGDGLHPAEGHAPR